LASSKNCSIPSVISIDGEYVPRIGDEVSFRKLLVPPKLEKYQVYTLYVKTNKK
jgi:hypothetical protein